MSQKVFFAKGILRENLIFPKKTFILLRFRRKLLGIFLVPTCSRATSALLTFPWEIKALSRIFVDFSEKGWGFSIAWRTFWGAVGPPLGAGKFPKKTRGLFATL